MIELKNNIVPLQTSSNFDVSDVNAILNRYLERKLKILKSSVNKLAQEWHYENFVITIEGKLNPNNPNPMVGIAFTWPESLEPDVNEQIQLLKDSFFEGK